MDESYERVAQETGMYHSEDRDRPRSEGRDGNVPGDPVLACLLQACRCTIRQGAYCRQKS